MKDEEKRAEIRMILYLYASGEYTTSVFCDELTEKYYYENSAYLAFTGEERALLDELVSVAQRFSPFDTDLSFEWYVNETTVKRKFNEIWGKLKNCRSFNMQL